jgi:lipocalin
MLKYVFLFIAMTIGFLGCVWSPKVNNVPVGSLEWDRYLGVWYEIARFDHSFERGIDCAKALYTKNTDGTIKVLNSGIKNGKVKTAVGKAKITETPAFLRVSFFGPFYADYRIMKIDSDYKYALVGSGGSNYLWLLSRTKEMPENVKAEFLEEAKQRGYDTTKLIWVNQKEN